MNWAEIASAGLSANVAGAWFAGWAMLIARADDLVVTILVWLPNQ